MGAGWPCRPAQTSRLQSEALTLLFAGPCVHRFPSNRHSVTQSHNWGLQVWKRWCQSVSSCPSLLREAHKTPGLPDRTSWGMDWGSPDKKWPGKGSPYSSRDTQSQGKAPPPMHGPRGCSLPPRARGPLPPSGTRPPGLRRPQQRLACSGSARAWERGLQGC